ncbi:MAG: hypothetical protein V7707_17605 [Motiliproteus sp.]
MLIALFTAWFLVGGGGTNLFSEGFINRIDEVVAADRAAVMTSKIEVLNEKIQSYNEILLEKRKRNPLLNADTSSSLSSNDDIAMALESIDADRRETLNIVIDSMLEIRAISTRQEWNALMVPKQP